MAIVTAIGPLLIGVGKFVVVIGKIIAIVPGVISILGTLGSAFTGLFTLLMANPIGLIVAAVVGLGVVIYKLYQNCEGFRNAVDAVFQWISEIPGKIAQFFTDTATNFMEWGSKMLEMAKAVGKLIVDGVIFIMIELPLRFWTAVFGAIGKFAEWGSKMLESGVTSATRILSNVVSIMTKLPGQIWNAIKSAISNMARWGSEMISTASSKMRQVASTIYNAVKNVPKQMFSIGKNIIYGIAHGIGDAVGYLYDSICNALSGLVDKAKEYLGIFSPSRVMAKEVGKFIPAGIGVGIEKIPTKRQTR